MGKVETPQELGIPEKIPINNRERHYNCNAGEAVFTSMEGEYAVYRGVCSYRHAYQKKILVKRKEVKTIKEATIQDGELVYGDNKGFEATGLEEL